jgi:hypothetical protein
MYVIFYTFFLKIIIEATSKSTGVQASNILSVGVAVGIGVGIAYI